MIYTIIRLYFLSITQPPRLVVCKTWFYLFIPQKLYKKSNFQEVSLFTYKCKYFDYVKTIRKYFIQLMVYKVFDYAKKVQTSRQRRSCNRKISVALPYSIFLAEIYKNECQISLPSQWYKIKRQCQNSSFVMISVAT